MEVESREVRLMETGMIEVKSREVGSMKNRSMEIRSMEKINGGKEA